MDGSEINLKRFVQRGTHGFHTATLISPLTTESTIQALLYDFISTP